MVGGIGGGSQPYIDSSSHQVSRSDGGEHAQRSGEGHSRISEEDRSSIASARDGLRAFIKGDGDRSEMVGQLESHVATMQGILERAQAEGREMPGLEKKIAQMETLLGEVGNMAPEELNSMDGEALWAIFQGNSEAAAEPDDTTTT